MPSAEAFAPVVVLGDMGHRWRVALVGMALPALFGCDSNACPGVGAYECASRTETATCAEVDNTFGAGQSRQWVTYPCPNGAYCELLDGYAFCSPVDGPVQQCAGESPSGFPERAACWENDLFPCMGGFLLIPDVGPTPCSGACTEVDDASCAYCLFPDASAEQDPACAQVSGTICEGHAAYQCACGLRTNELLDCTDGGLVCATGLDGTAVCALSSVQDPRCADQIGLAQTGAYCGDGGIVQCNDGYEVSFVACSCGPDSTSCDRVPDAGSD